MRRTVKTKNNSPALVEERRTCTKQIASDRKPQARQPRLGAMRAMHARLQSTSMSASSSSPNLPRAGGPKDQGDGNIAGTSMREALFPRAPRAHLLCIAGQRRGAVGTHKHATRHTRNSLVVCPNRTVLAPPLRMGFRHGSSPIPFELSLTCGRRRRSHECAFNDFSSPSKRAVLASRFVSR